MNRDEQIRTALRELRSRLGKTQTEFADYIGKSYPMVRVYESERTPQGLTLAQFISLASSHGYTDLAAVFSNALLEDLGQETVDAILRAVELRTGNKENISTVTVPQSVDPRLVGKFIDFMKSRQGSEKDQALRVLLPRILMSFTETATPAKTRKKKTP